MISFTHYYTCSHGHCNEDRICVYSINKNPFITEIKFNSWQNHNFVWNILSFSCVFRSMERMRVICGSDLITELRIKYSEKFEWTNEVKNVTYCQRKREEKRKKKKPKNDA